MPTTSPASRTSSSSASSSSARRSATSRAIPGGRYYYDYGGAPYQVYLWNGYVTNATAKRTSVYAQDTWTVTDRLTANLGLRLDVNRGSVPTGTVLSNHALAPRVGVAFDVTGDHQTVVRAQLRPLLRRAVRRPVRVHGPEPAEHEDHRGGARPEPLPGAEPRRRRRPTSGSIRTSGSRTPISSWSASNGSCFRISRSRRRYINRRFRDFMGFIDTGSIYAPVQKVDPGVGRQAGTADDGAVADGVQPDQPGQGVQAVHQPGQRLPRLQRVPADRDQALLEQLAGVAVLHLVARRRHGEQHRRHERRRQRRTSRVSVRPATFADPNHFINARRSDAIFDYTNQVKLDGTYRVPAFGGFNVSGGLSLHHRPGVGTHGDDSRPRSGQRNGAHRAARHAADRSDQQPRFPRREDVPGRAPAIAGSASTWISSTSTTRA